MRGDPDNFVKELGKMLGVFKSNGKGDVDKGIVCACHQLNGLIDPVDINIIGKA